MMQTPRTVRTYVVQHNWTLPMSHIQSGRV
jgi:hypothetical protein